MELSVGLVSSLGVVINIRKESKYGTEEFIYPWRFSKV